MSIISYSDESAGWLVVLPYAQTTVFRQEAVGDDLANVDSILTSFDITVVCVIHHSYIGMLAPDLDPSVLNPAAIMNVIRDRLLARRKQLSVKINGVELIPQPQVDPDTGSEVPGTVDARNGPIPISCTISNLTSQSFLMSYHITANYHTCPEVDTETGEVTNNLAGSPVLYNRWSESVTIDDCNYSVRVREGKFMIRSDNVDAFTADQMRTQMAILGVPEGFLRQSSSYTQDPSGLAITYTITDKEVYLLPPAPAFKADGEFSLVLSKQGFYRIATCRVRLTADKITAQDKLLETCVGVCLAKLVNGSVTTVPGSIAYLTLLESIGITAKIWENEVECRIQGIIKPGQKTAAVGGTVTGKEIYKGMWAIDFKKITETPPGLAANTFRQPPYLQRGTAGLLLQAAAYYDPCLRTAALVAGTGQLNTGVAVGRAANVLEGAGVITTGEPSVAALTAFTETQDVFEANILTAFIPPDNPLGAAYQDTGSSDLSIYTEFHIESRWEKDGHIYAGGVTSPSGFLGQSSAFVQLTTPTGLWVADWTALRTYDKPEIPNPNPSSGSNWILLDEWYTIPELTVGPDGTTPVWRISGTFVYGARTPSALFINDVAWGLPPWIPLTSFNRAVFASLQTNGLIYP